MMSKMYVIVDLETWRENPETLIKPPAKILEKEEATVILSPYGFPEHKAVRFLIEIEEIKPGEWEKRERGIFYGGTPENPRRSLTKHWEGS